MSFDLEDMRKLIKEMYVDHAGAFVPTGHSRVETIPPDPSVVYDKDDLYHAVMDAKRILENLPLQDLPEDITKAIEFLRAGVDQMPAPENYEKQMQDTRPESVAASEPPGVDNRSAPVNRYLEENNS